MYYEIRRKIRDESLGKGGEPVTLPSEEVRSIEITREFLRWFLTAKAKDLKIKDLRERAARCLHHYPFQIHVEERWDDVCHDCKTDKQWCRCKTDKCKKGSDG
jgi:hypothetical protein